VPNASEAPSNVQIKPRARRTRRVLVILALLGLLLTIAAELILRAFVGLGDPPIYFTDDKFEYAVKPGTYRRFGHEIFYNRSSMRSAEIEPKKTDPRELRFLILGDSIVNGGSPTSNSELATTLLEPKLSQKFGRPTRVLNISQGSWGPRNVLGYLEKFGAFDADAAVLVLNSIDYGDEPTFAPLTADQPTTRPIMALQEALQNYLPRAIEKLVGPSGPAEDDTNPPTERGNRSLDSLSALVTRLREEKVPLVVVMHLRRTEVEGRPLIGHAKITQRLKELGVEVIESSQVFQKHYADTPPILRDDAHPSGPGQRILAEVLEAAIDRALAQPAKARQ
jgi:hypothetical protein